MRLSYTSAGLLAGAITALLSSGTDASSSYSRRSTTPAHLQARNPTGNFDQLYLASNYQNLSAAPGASPSDAGGQTVITSGGDYGNDDGQTPACPTIFIQTANNNGSETGGWTSIPQVVGFYVDRNTTSKGATLPVYMETKDFSKIKRVVIAGPGKPRDSWKYTNLFRNSLICAVANSSMPVELEDVLVVGPMWLTQNDIKAGAGQSTDLYFSDGGWATGSKAQGPGNPSDGSFDLLDKLVTRLADQSEFPALTSITLAGHSLGGSLMQRYAMLRRDDASTDPLVRFWVGNPGAYVWPMTTRPVTPTGSAACSNASTIDEWAYGISGSLPAYAYHVYNNNTAIYQRYFGRTIQYALGLLDDGPGDTHCEAQYEGTSHLNRGQNLQTALQGMSGGIPSTQQFNFVPDTSHQDYKMMADPNSQTFLFSTGLSDARPAGTTSKSSSGKKSSSKSNTSSSGSGSSSGAGRMGGATPLALASVAVAIAGLVSVL